jgi:hypothetical protein
MAPLLMLFLFVFASSGLWWDKNNLQWLPRHRGSFFTTNFPAFLSTGIFSSFPKLKANPPQNS